MNRESMCCERGGMLDRMSVSRPFSLRVSLVWVPAPMPALARIRGVPNGDVWKYLLSGFLAWRPSRNAHVVEVSDQFCRVCGDRV